MSFEIAPVGSEAASEVIELIHRVFDEYGFSWEPEEEFWDLLAGGDAFPYVEPRGALWVMRDSEGRVVGSVAAERLDGRTVEMHRLYLDARLRGRGHGRQLFETAVSWARAHGAARIELWSDTNFRDAHRLYERLGYVKTGSRVLDDANDSVEFRYERDITGSANCADSAASDGRPPAKH